MIRYAVLSVYMVLSPLMFLGWVFPGLQSVSSKYWRGFLGRAFFAPVYILMLYFAAFILRAFYSVNNSLFGAPQMGELFSGSDTSINATFSATLPPFILSIIFLIAALVIANKLGAEGASQAVKLGGNIANRARRGVVNTTKWGGKQAMVLPRYGARHVSNHIGNRMNQSIKQWQQGEGKVGRNRLGRWAANTVAVDSAMHNTATKLKNVKAGFANTVDENRAAKSEINTRVDNHHNVERGISAQNELETEKQTPGSISTTGSIWDPNANNGAGAMVDRSELTPEEIKPILEQNAAKMQSVVTDYSTKQLEEMFKSSPQQFANIVGHLKTDQFDKLMSSDNLDKGELNSVFTQRQTAIRSLVEKDGQILTGELKDMSIHQLKVLGDQFIRANAHLFTKTQMDDLKKSTDFSEAQKGSYVAARKDKVNEIIASGNTAEIKKLTHNVTGTTGDYDPETNQRSPVFEEKTKKVAELAELPLPALQHPSVMPHVSVDVLKEITRNARAGKGNLTSEEMEQFANNLLTMPGVSPKIATYLNSKKGQEDWFDRDRTQNT